MGILSRRAKSNAAHRASRAVVYKGAGASLLGDNPPVRTKKQADAVIDALLGKNRAS